MLTAPMDVVKMFPVRKTKKQKMAFRAAVQSYASSQGWKVTTEQGRFGVSNLVIGDPETAEYLITAHYDTCARMPISNVLIPDNSLLYGLYQLGINLLAFAICVIAGGIGALVSMFLYSAVTVDPNGLTALGLGIVVFFALFLGSCFLVSFMAYWGPANRNNANDNTSGVVTLLEILRSLPDNQRNKVCFVLFDQNETGLVGSRFYRNAHKQEVSRQLVLNLSCVGDGDDLLIIPTSKLKKDLGRIKSVFKCCGYFGRKSLLVMDKGISLIPSDHKNFPYGVCFMAFHKGKKCHYITRIHTSRDTILDQTNVNILRAAIISMVCCDAI